MGFKLTHFDNNIWLKERSDGTGCNHLSAHVDDVLCMAKNPQCCVHKLAKKCNQCDGGPPTQCLRCSCTKLGGHWLISAGELVKEAASRIKAHMGTLSGKQVPSMTNCNHPVMNDLPLLSDDGV